MNNEPQKITDTEADMSLMNLTTGHVEKIEMEIESSPGMDSVDQSNPGGSPDLGPTERRVLIVIVKNPMLPSSKYPKLAGISPNTWQKIRSHFVEKGWIRQHRLQTGNRGRSTVLIEPLDAGIQLVNKFQSEGGNHAG